MKPKHLFLIAIAMLIVSVFSCKKDDSSTTTPPLNLVVGQTYQGGIIAYIDPTGQHGLIAYHEDWGSYPWWENSSKTFKKTNAISTTYGTGQANTRAIVSVREPNCYIAAYKIDTLVSEGYSDWYLPSQDEMYKIYANRNAIGSFLQGYYWTSSEIAHDSSLAIFCDFTTQGRGGFYVQQKNYHLGVMPVRSF